MSASRACKGDLDNMRLASVMSKARTANMARDRIEAAINRGISGNDDSQAEELIYEGQGPNGSVLMIKTLTNNKNRTVPDVRSIFSKNGGTLGTSGSSSWAFNKTGFIKVDKENIAVEKYRNEDDFMELAIDCGAEDIEVDASSFKILCEPDKVGSIRSNLINKGLQPSIMEIIYQPKSLLSLAHDDCLVVETLIETLYEHEDVQQVFHNVDLKEAADQEGVV